MRLWSLHPRYLDAKGLAACWRESLLALAVLSGKTRGYRQHPQLERFRSQEHPIAAIRQYLDGLYKEAETRGYDFDRRKIGRVRVPCTVPVTLGQARFELSHLKRKLWKRDRVRYFAIREIKVPELHPLFHLVKGNVERWERGR